MTAGGEGALRLDKWLWHARFVRTRALAMQWIGERRVRVNGQLAIKTHQLVRPGDVLTLKAPVAVAVVRVTGLGERRGTAAEARLLYEPLAQDP
ncbi:S4 domain-containing protein [Geminicoccaceae bacterium 1502E]|nr:S4 domain-containing protein [Geminicoccaceae bacterium 1502E]